MANSQFPAIQAYLKSIGQTRPNLSAEEERIFVVKAQNGDQDAMLQIIRAMAGLLLSKVKSSWAGNSHADDMLQSGTLAICSSVNVFRVDRTRYGISISRAPGGYLLTFANPDFDAYALIGNSLAWVSLFDPQWVLYVPMFRVSRIISSRQLMATPTIYADGMDLDKGFYAFQLLTGDIVPDGSVGFVVDGESLLGFQHKTGQVSFFGDKHSLGYKASPLESPGVAVNKESPDRVDLCVVWQEDPNRLSTLCVWHVRGSFSTYVDCVRSDRDGNAVEYTFDADSIEGVDAETSGARGYLMDIPVSQESQFQDYYSAIESGLANALTDVQALAIRMRYGIGVEPTTLKGVAKFFGWSVEQARTQLRLASLSLYDFWRKRGICDEADILYQDTEMM